MALDEEKVQHDGNKIGFAGLSSMLSDIDATLSGVIESQQREAARSSTAQSPKTASSERQSQPRPTQAANHIPAKSSGGSSAGKWWLGVMVLFGIIWLANPSTEDGRPKWLANQSTEEQMPKPSYSSEPASTVASSAKVERQPIANTVVPSRPVEEKPSISRNNVLSTAQLRYCIAEKIRLDTAESEINSYIKADVDRFNNYVNDYNSRCGEFRYRPGTLESARRDVELYRSQLQSEGRSRFARNSSEATKLKTVSSTQPARLKFDETVKSIQHRLNELGYDVGAADGILGRKTRAAIISFQQITGMDPDGLANQSLLSRLNASVQSSIKPQKKLDTQSETETRISEAAPQVVNRTESSSDRENFNMCISGKYPSLCKHSLLTRGEAVLVDSAEKRENYSMCITGKYPSLCKHSLLTLQEAAQVDSAEKRANYSLCITGKHPSLCKHSLLTQQEATQVDSAERLANYRMCITGKYPSLCKHSLLTREEAQQVQASERRANFNICKTGNYPSLCNHSLLTQGELAGVREAERRAQGN